MAEEIVGFMVGESSKGLNKSNIITKFSGKITSFTNTSVGIDDVIYPSWSPMMHLSVDDYCEFKIDADRWIVTGKILKRHEL